MSFALVLTLLVAGTGLFWVWRRIQRLPTNARGEDVSWQEHVASFFPLLLLVLVIRSFLIEPFRIPSGSLEPSLLIGDFVAVNKYDYGVRLPVSDKKILAVGEPKRGAVVVFSWPPKPSFDYIKRVIGVPGDVVEYKDKVLTVNGKEAKQTFIKDTQFVNQNGMSMRVKEYSENLLGVKHKIFIRPSQAPFNFKVTVPDGYYYMMGDNRDDSSDSRYWGFVPEKNLRGRAFMVWLSWNSMKSWFRFDRIGTSIN